MKESLNVRIKKYLSGHKRRRRIACLLCVLSLCVATGVYGLLMIPAISRENKNPLIETVSDYALYGDTIRLQVSATAESGAPETVFLLAAEELGAGLSAEYPFDDDGETELLAESGNAVTLHREEQPDGTTQYWFVLSENSTEKLTIDCATPPLETTTATQPHEPTYEEPVYEEPIDEEPTYEEPIYDEPTYEEPTYEEPTYEEPIYEEPVYEEPVYEEPVYEEPTYDEPVYEEPTYDEPTYEEPTAPVCLMLTAACGATLEQAREALNPEDTVTYRWLLTQDEVDAAQQQEAIDRATAAAAEAGAAAGDPAGTTGLPLAELQANIDGLPTPAALRAMTAEEQSAVRERLAQLQAAALALDEADYAALGEERLRLLTELTSLLAAEAGKQLSLQTIQSGIDALPAYESVLALELGGDDWLLAYEQISKVQTNIIQYTENMSEAEYVAFADAVGAERMAAYAQLLDYFAQMAGGLAVPMDAGDYNYHISLNWKDGGTAYADAGQSLDTLNLVYELTINVSNGMTYPTGQMQVDIPHALFEYRDLTPGDDSDDKFCKTADFGIPLKGSGETGAVDFEYEIVTVDGVEYVRVTNTAAIGPGNVKIQFSYDVDRLNTVDGTAASLTASAVATGTKNGVPVEAETAVSNAITFTEDTGITLNMVDKAAEAMLGVPDSGAATDNAGLQGGRIHTWDESLYGPQPADFATNRWVMFEVRCLFEGNQPAVIDFSDVPQNGGSVYAIALEEPNFTRISHRGEAGFTAAGTLQGQSMYRPLESIIPYTYSQLTYASNGSASITVSPYAGGDALIANDTGVVFHVIVKYPRTQSTLTNVGSVTLTPVDEVDPPQTDSDSITIPWKNFQAAYTGEIVSVDKCYAFGYKTAYQSGSLMLMRFGLGTNISTNDSMRITASKAAFTATSAPGLTGSGTNGLYQLEMGDDMLLMPDSTQPGGYYRLDEDDVQFYCLTNFYVTLRDVTSTPTAYTREDVASMLQVWVLRDGQWERIMPYSIGYPTIGPQREYKFDVMFGSGSASHLGYLGDGVTKVKVLVTDLHAYTECDLYLGVTPVLRFGQDNYVCQYLNRPENADLEQLEIFNLDYAKLYVGQTDGSYVWMNPVSADSYDDLGDSGPSLGAFVRTQDMAESGQYVQREWAKCILSEFGSSSAVRAKGCWTIDNGTKNGQVVVFNVVRGGYAFWNCFPGIVSEADLRQAPAYQPLRDMLEDYNTMVFYDLLPLGMQLDTDRDMYLGAASTISPIKGVAVAGASGVMNDDITIDYEIVSTNYKGSGRTLVKFTASAENYCNLSTFPMGNLPSQEGDAVTSYGNYGLAASTMLMTSDTSFVRDPPGYTWLSLGYQFCYYTVGDPYDLYPLKTKDRYNHVVMQYESGAAMEVYPNLPANPPFYGLDDGQYFQSETGNGPDGKPLLYDMRGDGVTAVYDTRLVRGEYSLTGLLSLANGVKKQVRTEDDQSIYADSATVSEGERYYYKLSYQHGIGESRQVILFDYLEKAYETGEAYWQGTPVSIDITDFNTKNGRYPTLYYSTDADAPQFTTTAPPTGSGWVRLSTPNGIGTFPTNVTVKAIAISCGSYVFKGIKQVSAIVTMQSPDGPLVDPTECAYNNLALYSQFRASNTAAWTTETNTTARVAVGRRATLYNLPATGGEGYAALYAAGAVLLSAGLLFLLQQRRRKQGGDAS